VNLRLAVPLILRLTLGALLIVSGGMKLGFFNPLALALALDYLRMDPIDFAFAIKAFKMGLGDGLVSFAAYTVAWGELLTGLLLLIGLWTRGAVLATIVLMGAFAVGIVSLMHRGIDVKCPCFGKLQLFCGDVPLGLCHILRNACFAAAAGVVLWLGPGMGSIDGWLARRRSPVPTPV
jgi:uncharacterized membrane protein YphA (DoxX/SURF4 family)